MTTLFQYLFWPNQHGCLIATFVNENQSNNGGQSTTNREKLWALVKVKLLLIVLQDGSLVEMGSYLTEVVVLAWWRQVDVRNKRKEEQNKWWLEEKKKMRTKVRISSSEGSKPLCFAFLIVKMKISQERTKGGR